MLTIEIWERVIIDGIETNYEISSEGRIRTWDKKKY